MKIIDIQKTIDESVANPKWITVMKWKTIVDIVLTIVYFGGYFTGYILILDLKKKLDRADQNLVKVEQKLDLTLKELEKLKDPKKWGLDNMLGGKK